MNRLMRIAMLAALSLPVAAIACPNCKESIPNSDAVEAASVPAGFNNSIYYMLGGLFLTTGLVVSVITKGVKTSTRMPPRNDA